ncbi:UNVERIFIED_CONTAM: hypothetical protein PYX00_001365 [Menopon gallinae]|uniref:AAA+ ATPase domain-containing protein n=1 Tax=Menopon gallinae TaxID=328185 RepID=A0AAW2ICB6_9NEOP
MFFNYVYLNSHYGKLSNIAKLTFHNRRAYCVIRNNFNKELPWRGRHSRSYGCMPQKSIRHYLVPNGKSQRLLRRSDVWTSKVFQRNKSSDNKPEPDIALLVKLVILVGPLFVLFFLLLEEDDKTISWSTFVHEMLAKGEVQEIIQLDKLNRAVVVLRPGAVIRNKQYPNGQTYNLKIEDEEYFEDRVRDVEEELGIPPNGRVLIIHKSHNQPLLGLFIMLFAFYIILRAGKTAAMFNPFTRIAKARFTLIDPLSGHTKGVKFSDVGGLKEAKVEIMEFVDYLKRPEHYRSLGAKVPKGALLLGPPGCGKTLLAKAVASEANVPFLSMNGSEFIELIGGLGAARVRDLFSEARKISPCIIYIDEIDAIGKKRADMGTFGGVHTESEHTLNQLLVEMDGMATREGVVMLASTNRAEVLDIALLRPGRFDRHITIDLPNLEERKEIFIQYLKGIRLEREPEHYCKRMASLTPGFSGADIANICNEAALHAARLKKEIVKGEDLEYAIERVVGGTEKRTSAISHEEKHLVAYHEAGRALIGWLSEHGEILLKISVVPRTNQAVGWSQFSPPEQYLFSEQELFDKMCMALGGRVAEMMIFNKISTRSEQDLKRVTRIAYAQICQYGMNSVVGPISFRGPDSDGNKKPYSKQFASVMDEEARKLVAKAFFRAEDILRQNKDKLVKLAETLLKRETMNYHDVMDVIGPPVKKNKKTIEPLMFDLSVVKAGGPEQSTQEKA